MIETPVYLDNCATTACDPRVVETMLPFFSTQFGNASSHSHLFGWQAEEAVQKAREQVARLINADPSEVIFTSGATEADNLALKGVFETYHVKGNHIITCVTEHKAVLDTCQHLEKLGAEITYLPVDRKGLINVDDVEAAIRPKTVVISVMYANNETGTIMPVKDISSIAKKHGVLLFTDATQAVGKINVDVDAQGIDIMAFSAHKIYGPKGVGALYVRRKNPRVKLTAQLDGGGHERGMRSGTLNVLGIVGFGAACDICRREMSQDAARLAQLRDRLEKELLKTPGVLINGDEQNRLPNVSNMCFGGADGSALLGALGSKLAVSSGSACMSASLEPSYVLSAMGLSDEQARNSIRFSVGRFNTEQEIDYAIDVVKKELKALQSVV